MKHIYIICIFLSSFFTYTSAYAKNNEITYAFYIPQEAFQQNTSYNSNNYEHNNTHQKKNIINTSSIQKDANTDVLPKKALSKSTEKKIKKNKKRRVQKRNRKQQKTIPTNYAKSTSLDSSSQKDATANSKNNIKEANLSQILSNLPSTDLTLPKFQQIYTDYLTSLRIFYKNRKFPINIEQEEILEKANTTRHFEVKY